jgi:hypothetical protein
MFGATWESGDYGNYLKLDCPSLSAPVNAIMSVKATESASICCADNGGGVSEVICGDAPRAPSRLIPPQITR